MTKRVTASRWKELTPFTTLTSNCIFYTQNKIANVLSKDYPNNNLKLKPILPVEVSTTGNPGVDNDIKFIVKISSIEYTIDVKVHEVILDNKNAGVFINYPISDANWHTIKTPNGKTIYVQNGSTNRVVLNEGTSLDKDLYSNGDEYIIDMISCIDNNLITGISVTFTRKNNVSFNSDICRNYISNNCVKIKIPDLHICGQSLMDGSDVSDIKFTILDDVEYYEEKTIICCKNNCQNSRGNIKDLKTTTFIKCGIWMVSVIRGEGNTLRDKLLYLIETENIQIEINDFLEKIIKYGMTRYILCRILYGNFNIRYLLKRKYEKFIKDLGRSRFCRFVDFFEDCMDGENNFIGYEKYFL